MSKKTLAGRTENSIHSVAFLARREVRAGSLPSGANVPESLLSQRNYQKNKVSTVNKMFPGCHAIIRL